MSISVENLCVKIGNTILVEDVSFALKRGELVVLLGPNGAGKTTLLKACLDIIPKTSGTVTYEDTPAADLSPQARARAMAYLPQIQPLTWPNRVKDIVALGRFAYGANPSTLKGEDQSAVDHALSDCELSHMAERSAETLSGGEQARLHFARALAAQTPFLLADEPVAALDPHHQFKVLGLIRRYVDQGNGALVILHDIALAARYADRLLWMKDGQLKADGSVAETLTVERLKDIYNVDADINGTRVELLGPRG
ncbi:MAG: ABC transporter ATP-binding protein [Maricaulaceae bacterium]